MNSRSPPASSAAGLVLRTSDAAAPIHAESVRLAIMRVLQSRPAISQRELAVELGISLGKTHYVLRALLDKGLVKVRNFQRSHNKLAYAYLLTPAGIREKSQLTRTFLKRKEEEFAALTHVIASLRNELEQDAHVVVSEAQSQKGLVGD